MVWSKGACKGLSSDEIDLKIQIFSSDKSLSSLMSIPRLLTISPGRLVRVTDADEEVFALYTGLAGSSERASEFDAAKSEQARRHPTQAGSLGFVDSGASTIGIRLEIRPPTQQAHGQSMTGRNTKKGRKAKTSSSSQGGREIEVELKQDIFATKYRSGDTGSLVWRASIDFAELLWYELLFPSPHAPSGPGEDEDTCWRGFLDMARLTESSRILELGAGTGSLAILCAGMFPSASRASWTASDQFDLLTIIARNLAHNRIAFSTGSGSQEEPHARYTIEEIDWLAVETQWLKTQGHPRLATSEPADCSSKRYDLILAVDCLYNESLILPLLRTIDHFGSVQEEPCSSGVNGPTLVLVVSELRSSDVVEAFVRHWLALRPAWTLCRLPIQSLRPELNLNLAKPRYVVWCGWKN
ncbi:hypothetical protein PTTG_00024 [Puccinia triticina 1-1 BBBD Race 1]|uniref:Uncharacterized protein n=2 Tax=Puccinia triticina TaxID=208348 RepID=A0A180GDV9_PUCT1|nr:uncharacterized protein PtA15_4A87 [Puccinia triticina]OAV90754.1 hypothetical protein PTTG_00024 [Puccinia triticina 1-1 BBBD Race 1]WAQ83639.1 hypothetical protein PtA15_4A87 [Puccinia triticina]WAR54481.1 hypothetical protein PtB15_4B98 [Puccinia triticina]